DVVARRAIIQLAHAVTAGPTFQTLIELVHRLTHFNTRLTLLAIAGYVASGHHEWSLLLRSVATQRDYEISRNKAFKAVLLGARSVLQTSSSWVQNIFTDGTNDSIGATLTLRILMQFTAVPHDRGLTVDEIAATLERLFGWSDERIRRRLDTLWK